MHEVVSIAADIGGCSLYRMTMPNMLCRNNNIVVVDSQKPILQPDFYKSVRLVRVQRMLTPPQCEFVTKFLKPLSEAYGFWLNYDIDDCIGAKDVPKYNTCWSAYQEPSYQTSIKATMNVCDYVTVTTQALKEYIHATYNVPLTNIIVIPNYLPKWWIGGLYYPERVEARWDSLSQRKPRICFPLSSSHFDMANQNNGIDDFTHLLQWVNDNLYRYDFTFVGGIPQQLKDHVSKGQVKFINGFSLFNYPKELSKLDQDLFIAPLMDNTFNRCKSPIKVLESSALGVPCLCQDLPTYRPYTDLLWKDSKELDDYIHTLLHNKAIYMGHVTSLHEKLNKGYWLEDHMNDWMELYNIPQRTLCLSLQKSKEFALPSAPTKQPIQLNLGVKP